MTERYGLVKASREAVRLWVHKLESLAYHGPPKPRRLVAIDETKAKLEPQYLRLPTDDDEGLRQQAPDPG
jgi:hypothetical protein